MEFYKKIEVFTNIISGSVKTRRIQDNYMPSAADNIRNIERANEIRESSWTSIINMCNGVLPDKYNVFSNRSIGFNLISNNIDVTIANLNTKFVESIHKARDIYTQLSKSHDIDFSKQLNQLDLLSTNFSSDPAITHTINKLLEFKKFCHQGEATIKSIEAVMYKEQRDVQQGRAYFDNNLDTNPYLKPLKDLLIIHKDVYQDYTPDSKFYYDNKVLLSYSDSFNSLVKEMYHQLRESTKISFCQAEDFKDNQLKSKASVLSFLTNKENESTIKYKLEFEQSRYSEILFFKDDSIMVKDSRGHYIDILENKEVKVILETLIKDEIKFRLRKTPTMCKDFLSIAEPNLFDCRYLESILNTYQNNEDILKTHQYNFKKAYKESADKYTSSYRILENMNDTMHAIIKDHKIQQLAHSISSNKYMHLYDEKSYKIVELIYDLKIDESKFQDYIGKKMAAYKTTEEFNTALRQFVASLDSFNPFNIEEKANQYDARIISYTDDIMILEITDFEQSTSLGSSSWCISREESYFESYTENNNVQYFIYDFNKLSSDNNSMIGITLDSDGLIYAAHLKNDDSVEQDSPAISQIVDMIFQGCKNKDTITIAPKNILMP